LAVPGGRVVIFGRTAGTIPEVTPELLFRKQLSVFGTTMGSRDEFLSMLDFVHKHKLRPVIAEVFPLDKAEDALLSLETENRFGKIVLRNLP
jgi:D-arabinose 1-dehydrogenase-like Zn-dependent alcohol dehydrogenase